MEVDKRILDKYLNRQKSEICSTCQNYQNGNTVDNKCAYCEVGSNYVGV